MPGKVDDDNSSYQVFLRFNFGFGEDREKVKPKQKPIKTTKLALEVKEAKETDDIEQTIDELLAADIEALKDLNQNVDQKMNQDLPDEIKALNEKLETTDIENIKQPK